MTLDELNTIAAASFESESARIYFGLLLALFFDAGQIQYIPDEKPETAQLGEVA
ncbi:hypothetical protein K3X44_09925 [Aliiroseovarius crassostreae]|uniref:hypothetical protein n=1 Tax=Aliiroseovarius crassostreae TaxID=154981 RepID=UPI0021FD7A0F|nr:hypothetical protein [Aliiroseovarius crassostreae]UWQ00833.1 hypothetical protein K3X44_09925 [Aliiroseovarius crassostreae]